MILSRDPTKGDVNSIDIIKVTETIKEGSTIFKLTAEEQRKARLMLKPDGRGDTAFSRFARGASSHGHGDEAHADSCLSPVLMQMVAAIAGTDDDSRQ